MKFKLLYYKINWFTKFIIKILVKLFLITICIKNKIILYNNCVTQKHCV